MKVLLAHKFNYLKGGGEKYFFDLADMLAKKGLDVAKFSMADPRNIPDKYEKYFVDNVDFNKIKITNIFRYLSKGLKGVYSFEAYRKFEKLILYFKPDIIHIQNIYHQISPSILTVAKKNKIPVIMHLHDYKLICPNYKLFSKGKACFKCKGGKYYNCALNKCLKNSYIRSLSVALEMYFHHNILKIYDNVDLFIAPSQYMKDISAEFGIPAEKIEVVNNFIDPGGYDTQNDKNNDDDYLLYIGRLVGEKGVDVLIEASKKINNGLKLKIVGDGPEYINYQLSISNYQLENRVQLLGSIFDKDRVNSLISGSKAMVVPSVWPENFPYVVLEAFLFGKPVIASRIGGLKDMVSDGRNGFLFEAGNASDLAEKINKISNMNLEEFSGNAKKEMEKYLPEKHLERILEIYDQYAK